MSAVAVEEYTVIKGMVNWVCGPCSGVQCVPIMLP